MPNLYTGDHVESDLQTIADRNGRNDADDLRSFLEELGSREDALWQLVRHRSERTYPSPTFNSRMIEILLGERYNIGRIRPVPRLSKYRILYAYDNQHDDIYVLAIVEKLPVDVANAVPERYYDYERNHPVTSRIVDEYDSLGIPRIAGH